MLISISLGTIIATVLGGAFALRFRDKLHLILGFSAGAVIGVAFFDLLPEAINLGGSQATSFIATIIALGFALYLLLDQFVGAHCHAEEGDCHNTRHRGVLGAASLSLHSFLDGVGIGLAFKISPAVGAVVAAAVLAHDFSDGINTVNMVIKNGGTKRAAVQWLCVDAIAPAVGVIATLFFTVSQSVLSIAVALFCGFFLYIGASELLPESHHGHSQALTTIMTLLGMVVIYLAVHVAGL